MSVFTRVVLTGTELSPLRRLFTNTSGGRALSRRFVAGETLEEAVTAAADLNAAGAAVSLDHLGEHVTDRDAAEAACEDYLACLRAIGDRHLDANISIKMSQLGMGLDDSLAAGSLDRLAVAAAAADTTVTVDMEESAFTETTITIFEKVQAAHGNLGIAVQAYLYRTRADLDRLIHHGGHIRLCKGAYAEPSEVAFQRGVEIDGNFDTLLRVLMESPWVKPAVATHDDDRIAAARSLARSREEPWEFQMLYGVRRPLQAELISAGYPLRVYVPYGSAWYPYLTRRLAERPSNLRFFLRAATSR